MNLNGVHPRVLTRGVLTIHTFRGFNIIFKKLGVVGSREYEGGNWLNNVTIFILIYLYNYRFDFYSHKEAHLKTNVGVTVLLVK